MWCDWMKVQKGTLCAAGFIVMMSLSVSTQAQTGKETTLYSFTGGTDGYAPLAGLVFDTKGNLYGVTYFGGTVNDTCHIGCGTVFQVKPGKNGGWTYKTIHSFAGGTDFGFPQGRLAFDATGNLFGTAVFRGAGGYGGVFELSANAWKETLPFTSTSSTGDSPAAGLTLHQGTWYGTMNLGPQKRNENGGTIFSLAKGMNGQWKETTLHLFSITTDGYEPQTELVFDTQGNMYGSTPYGGPSQSGNILEFSPVAGGGWKETVLYNFSSFTSGVSLYPSTLILDSAGNLYGTTTYGGQGCGFGCGTVFELEHTKTGWKEITLYEFKGGSDGEGLYGGLLSDGQGHFYGTTSYGGIQTCANLQDTGCGTVFRLSQVNGVWQKTTIYSFLGANDGENPVGALVSDSAGNLYGVTSGGFAAEGTGYGTVFKIEP